MFLGWLSAIQSNKQGPKHTVPCSPLCPYQACGFFLPEASNKMFVYSQSSDDGNLVFLGVGEEWKP